jgi:CRP-like cAMP-binding protein
VIEKMLQVFSRLHPLTPAMEERIIEIASVREYPKKKLLLREGQTSDHACFVIKGVSRAFYVSNGREITTRFMDEGFIITSWLSFYTRKPGYEIIETLEDSVLACIHYNDLQQLYKELPEFNIVGRKLAEHFFYLSELRTQMLRKHKAGEKYQLFQEQHPGLIQRVPLKYIATYLGMSEETLSRVRNKMAHPKENKF